MTSIQGTGTHGIQKDAAKSGHPLPSGSGKPGTGWSSENHLMKDHKPKAH
jgi:hypothetical protein